SPPASGAFPPLGGADKKATPVPMNPGAGQKVVVADGDKNVLTTTFRAEDRFTTRHQEGSLVITVTGKVSGGKTQVGSIHIQDGAVMTEYGNVGDGPAR